MLADVDEGGVVAGVVNESPAFEFLDALHDVIEHVAVVADHEHCAGELVVQELLEPLDAGDVQVVGGLVQEQKLRRLQEQLGKRKTPLLTAGELAHLQVELRIGEAQPVEDGLDAVVRGVPAPGLDLVLDLGLAVKEALQSVGLGVLRLFQLVVDVLELGVELGELDQPGLGLVQERAGEIELGILGEIPDAAALGNGDGALIGPDAAGEHAQERRLAAPVASNQSDALPLVDRERDAVQQHAGADGIAEIGGGEQCHVKGRWCLGVEKCGAGMVFTHATALRLYAAASAAWRSIGDRLGR